jgi:methanogenic corrinoid protein MtbC1
MAAFVEQLSDTVDWPQETAPQDAASRRRAKPAVQAPDLHPLSGEPDARFENRRSQDGRLEDGGLAESLARSSRLALLTRVVEAEILPRLALARGAAAKEPAGRVVGAPASADPQNAVAFVTTAQDTEQLIRLLLAVDAGPAPDFVEALRARGASAEALFLGIISQAARVLGEMWEDDRCDFTQVTIGTGRLQQIVRALSPSFQRAAVRRPQPESVLLVPAPGEQHTFGLVLLGEFFCRAGWHVGGGPAMGGRDAADIVHNAWFDIVGFSVGSDLRLDLLSKAIHAVRRVSRNRDIGVMVGGPFYIAHPDMVGRVGADTGAMDAASAVQQASGLLSLRAATH